MAELTSESYHESESDSNYGEVLNTDSYYPSYNSTSDFSVSNRLLNTQQVHPKPYPPHQYSNNITQQNITYPSAYYGWLSTMPSEQGAIRNQSNHYNPPPNQTVYQIPNSNYPQLRYEQHQFVSPVPPPQPSCTNLPVQASPSPSHPCDSTLQGSPSNTSSWNNTGYPFPPAATADNMSMSPQVPTKTELQAQSNNIGNDSYSMLIKDQSTGIDNMGSGDLLNTDDVVGKNLPVMYEQDRKTDEDDDDSDARSNNGSETEPKKPKRTRTAFTTHQLDQLELCFASSAYPDAFTRDDISRRLNIKEDRIQVWFQNRRARHRKQERTGSVSIRSRARQQRVQRLKESHIMSSMYRYPQGNTVNRMLSPQTPSHSMSQFSFQVMTATSGPNVLPITTVSSPVQPSLYPFSVSETFLSHPPTQALPTNVLLVNGHHSALSGATNNES